MFSRISRFQRWRITIFCKWKNQCRKQNAINRATSFAPRDHRCENDRKSEVFRGRPRGERGCDPRVIAGCAPGPQVPLASVLGRTGAVDVGSVRARADWAALLPHRSQRAVARGARRPGPCRLRPLVQGLPSAAVPVPAPGLAAARQTREEVGARPRRGGASASPARWPCGSADAGPRPRHHALSPRSPRPPHAGSRGGRSGRAEPGGQREGVPSRSSVLSVRRSWREPCCRGPPCLPPHLLLEASGPWARTPRFPDAIG